MRISELFNLDGCGHTTRTLVTSRDEGSALQSEKYCPNKWIFGLRCCLHTRHRHTVTHWHAGSSIYLHSCRDRRLSWLGHALGYRLLKDVCSWLGEHVTSLTSHDASFSRDSPRTCWEFTTFLRTPDENTLPDITHARRTSQVLRQNDHEWHRKQVIIRHASHPVSLEWDAATGRSTQVDCSVSCGL